MSVYLIKAGDFYKVGRSRNIDSRMRSIAIDCPYKVNLLRSVDLGLKDSSLEIMIHKKLKSEGCHYRSEWFVSNEKNIEKIFDLVVDAAKKITFPGKSMNANQRAIFYLSILKQDVIFACSPMTKDRFYEITALDMRIRPEERDPILDFVEGTVDDQ